MERAAGLTDCHNHLHWRPVDEWVRYMEGGDVAGGARCVVNATCEGEWDRVMEMAARWPGRVVPALGIHPWHAAEAREGWEDRLERRVAADPRVTLGECGLDGAVPSAGQRAVFLPQVRMAREYGRLLTVHVVAAWGVLLDCLRDEPPPRRWLVHGYAGSLECARQLARAGAWFSANGRLLDPRRCKALEVFRRLPGDRVVLETDAPSRRGPGAAGTGDPPAGVGDPPADLAGIAAGLAAALGEDQGEFLARMEGNARVLLG